MTNLVGGKRNSPSKGFWIGALFANVILFAVIFDIIPNFLPFLEIDGTSGGILIVPWLVYMLVFGFIGSLVKKLLFGYRHTKK